MEKTNNMGLLNKTKCTIIGPIEHAPKEGESVREYFSKEFNKLNIGVFDHFNKPFIAEYVQESNHLQSKLKEWLNNEEYDKIAEHKPIRTYDLNLIDRSDFIIFHYIPDIKTTGSWEEFFWANRLKKPIFFITEGSKKNTPIWVFWTIKHKYIYSSKEECLEMIRKIDSKEINIDSDRWRLLKDEYR